MRSASSHVVRHRFTCEIGNPRHEAGPWLPLVTLKHLCEQDLEPDPPNNEPRIRKGTAVDRRVSVEAKDMRHGRKSTSNDSTDTKDTCERPGYRADPRHTGMTIEQRASASRSPSQCRRYRVPGCRDAIQSPVIAEYVKKDDIIAPANPAENES